MNQPFKRQPHKMVKHTQTVRDELLERKPVKSGGPKNEIFWGFDKKVIHI